MRSQRGSITPVWLALVLGTLLLFMVLVDREWVAYQLNKVEQTVDFAAEAGAATAQITYPLTVHGVRHHYVDETTCEPAPKPSDPPLCTTITRHERWPEDQNCDGDRQALQGAAWRQTCHCASAPVDGAWTCSSAGLRRGEAPRVTFPADMDDVVMMTFHANWTDIAGGRVSFPASIYPDTSTRSVWVPFTFIVSSPFGGDRWLGRTHTLWGRAMVQIPPLTLN